MSNPPIPLRLKLLRGNPGHRRLNRGEPQPTIPAEPPEPPSFLMPTAKDEWHEIIGELHALGLVTVLDRNVLAAYCQSYARWKQAEEMLAAMAERDPETGGLMIKAATGSMIYNPLLQAVRGAASDMLRYAAEFGLTPVARTRISAGVAVQGGKFAGLLAE